MSNIRVSQLRKIATSILQELLQKSTGQGRCARCTVVRNYVELQIPRFGSGLEQIDFIEQGLTITSRDHQLISRFRLMKFRYVYILEMNVGHAWGIEMDSAVGTNLDVHCTQFPTYECNSQFPLRHEPVAAIGEIYHGFKAKGPKIGFRT